MVSDNCLIAHMNHGAFGDHRFRRRQISIGLGASYGQTNSAQDSEEKQYVLEDCFACCYYSLIPEASVLEGFQLGRL